MLPPVQHHDKYILGIGTCPTIPGVQEIRSYITRKKGERIKLRRIWNGPFMRQEDLNNGTWRNAVTFRRLIHHWVNRNATSCIYVVPLDSPSSICKLILLFHLYYFQVWVFSRYSDALYYTRSNYARQIEMELAFAKERYQRNLLREQLRLPKLKELADERGDIFRPDVTLILR